MPPSDEIARMITLLVVGIQDNPSKTNVTIVDLKDQGYLETLQDPTNKNGVCSGSVNITKNSGSGTNGLYDLYFTANGTYVGITDFISDIENDSKLGFKIDDFKLKIFVIIPFEPNNKINPIPCETEGINIGKVSKTVMIVLWRI